MFVVSGILQEHYAVSPDKPSPTLRTREVTATRVQPSPGHCDLPGG